MLNRDDITVAEWVINFLECLKEGDLTLSEDVGDLVDQSTLTLELLLVDHSGLHISLQFLLIVSFPLLSFMVFSKELLLLFSLHLVDLLLLHVTDHFQQGLLQVVELDQVSITIDFLHLRVSIVLFLGDSAAAADTESCQ